MAVQPYFLTCIIKKAPISVVAGLSIIIFASHVLAAIETEQAHDLMQKISRGDQQALSSVRDQADKGDPIAQLLMGFLFEGGRGVKKDETEAAKWYQSAAEKGLAAAQYQLALLYGKGRGVNQDMAECLKWLASAAEQGIWKAGVELASAYEQGHHVQKDEMRAGEWYRRAATDGRIDDQMLVSMYTFSTSYIRESAHQWRARAQVELAGRYLEGRGVQKNCDEAQKWYQKAREESLSYKSAAERALQTLSKICSPAR